jgi:hypothetical protein
MPNEESVEGYCVPLSVEPGESIALHVGATRRLRQGAAEPARTELRFDIEIARIGATLFGDASAETCRRLAHGNAVLGTYTAGGTVISCGSTDWVFGLAGGDALIERITSNALERLLR